MGLNSDEYAQTAPDHEPEAAPVTELKRPSSTHSSESEATLGPSRGCRPRRECMIACGVVLALLIAIAAVIAIALHREYDAIVKESERLETDYFHDDETPRVVHNETGVLELETSKQRWIFNTDSMTGAELDAYLQTLSSESSGIDVDFEKLGDVPGFASEELSDSEGEGVDSDVFADAEGPGPADEGPTSVSRRLLRSGRELLNHGGAALFGGRPLFYARRPYNNLRADDDAITGYQTPAMRARPAMVKEHAVTTVRIMTREGGRCTGTLVAKNIVLTAAHCLAPPTYPAKRATASDVAGLRVELWVQNNVAYYTSRVRLARVPTVYRASTRNPQDQWDHDYTCLVLTRNLGLVRGGGWAGVKRMNFAAYGPKALPELRGKPSRTGLLTIFGYPTIYSAQTCDSTPCYQTNLMKQCRLGHSRFGTWFLDRDGRNLRHTCWSGPGGSGSSFQQHTFGRGWGYVVGIHVNGYEKQQKCALCSPKDLGVPNFLYFSMIADTRREFAAMTSLMKTSGALEVDYDAVPEPDLVPIVSTSTFGL